MGYIVEPAKPPREMSEQEALAWELACQEAYKKKAATAAAKRSIQRRIDEIKGQFKAKNWNLTAAKRAAVKGFGAKKGRASGENKKDKDGEAKTKRGRKKEKEPPPEKLIIDQPVLVVGGGGDANAVHDDE